MSGIYFLIRNKKIIYIGRSKNIFLRLLAHCKKDFDSVRIIKCDPDKAGYYEARWTKVFKPELNSMGLRGKKPLYDIKTLQIGGKIELSGKAKKYRDQYLYQFRKNTIHGLELIKEGKKVYVKRIS